MWDPHGFEAMRYPQRVRPVARDKCPGVSRVHTALPAATIFGHGESRPGPGEAKIVAAGSYFARFQCFLLNQIQIAVELQFPHFPSSPTDHALRFPQTARHRSTTTVGALM